LSLSSFCRQFELPELNLQNLKETETLEKIFIFILTKFKIGVQVTSRYVKLVRFINENHSVLHSEAAKLKNIVELMEQPALKKVNNYLNTNIYSSLETCGAQSSNLYLNLVQFFNTRVIWTSVAACYTALVSNMYSSIESIFKALILGASIIKHFGFAMYIDSSKLACLSK
jgi:hypothetical protein